MKLLLDIIILLNLILSISPKSIQISTEPPLQYPEPIGGWGDGDC